MTRRIIVTMFMLLALLVLCGCGRQTENETSTLPNPPQSDLAELPASDEPAEKPAEKPVTSTPENVEPVEYQVMSGERSGKDLTIGEYHSGNVDIDAAKRYARDIIVPRDTTDEEITATLHTALDDFREDHPNADELAVRAFFEESTSSSYANLYWAADGGKAFGHDSGSIQGFNRRPAELQKEERFGLSLEERQEVFRQLDAAALRASDEAYEKFCDDQTGVIDDYESKMQYERELQSKYDRQIREEYGITEDEQRKIVIEGNEQQWSLSNE